MKKFTLSALIVLISIFSLLAESYTAYPIMTGKNTLGINPFVYAATEEGFKSTGTDLNLSYGIYDNLDFWYSLSIADTNGAFYSSTWSYMARYDLYKGHILALKSTPATLSLQYHKNFQSTDFNLQVNGAVQTTYNDVEDLSAWAVVCPVYKHSEILDFYCEVNPGYYAKDGEFTNFWAREEGFGLDVTPGVGFIVKDVFFSIAAPIYDVTNDPTVTFGAWMYISITK